MTKHHLLKESHSKNTCIYCHAALKDKEWKSEFENEIHYKAILCGCGKKNTIKLNFHGSGHDFWNDNKEWFKRLNGNNTNGDKVIPLEAKIKELKRVDEFNK